MNKRAILVVHDDPSVINVIQPILESLWFDVTAVSSEEVLSTFTRVAPRFVVIAPCVPVARREEISLQLKAQDPRVTVFQLDSMSPKELQIQLAAGASQIQ